MYVNCYWYDGFGIVNGHVWMSLAAHTPHSQSIWLFKRWSLATGKIKFNPHSHSIPQIHGGTFLLNNNKQQLHHILLQYDVIVVAQLKYQCWPRKYNHKWKCVWRKKSTTKQTRNLCSVRLLLFTFCFVRTLLFAHSLGPVSWPLLLLIGHAHRNTTMCAVFVWASKQWQCDYCKHTQHFMHVVLYMKWAGGVSVFRINTMGL